MPAPVPAAHALSVIGLSEASAILMGLLLFQVLVFSTLNSQAGVSAFSSFQFFLFLDAHKIKFSGSRMETRLYFCQQGMDGSPGRTAAQMNTVKTDKIEDIL